VAVSIALQPKRANFVPGGLSERSKNFLLTPEQHECTPTAPSNFKVFERCSPAMDSNVTGAHGDLCHEE
jgi:hypothetical protein